MKQVAILWEVFCLPSYGVGSFLLFQWPTSARQSCFEHGYMWLASVLPKETVIYKDTQVRVAFRAFLVVFLCLSLTFGLVYRCFAWYHHQASVYSSGKFSAYQATVLAEDSSQDQAPEW
ncbi:hypothetical protein B0H65DRAFT_91045 [Neurospora tetraspora]|uniref:Uncharacterized protein n=1 Tax=Neurospora tetraspora TaxID=94610 RepID=A0AAE0JJG4_9PEZI|nr:hypothetical protein B0H65DRAFT_91045 [Neurospora tetraspora]